MPSQTLDVNKSALSSAPTELQTLPRSKKIVSIIGHGYVGKIVEKFFSERFEVRIFDPLNDKSHSQEEINKADLAIISVPTPMNDQGACDTSIVEDVLSWIETPLILLRSTVPPGTTDRLMAKTGKKIVFSPEYAGESKYWTPYAFHTDEREMPFYILGGDVNDCQRIIDLYAIVAGPTKQYRTTTAKIAETVKYFENEYFAWKVMWATELRETCEAIGVPFWEVRDLWALDPRVEAMHTAAFADNPGFGGKCFPKDTAALYAWAKAAGYEKKVLKAIIDKNKILRRGRGDYPEELKS